MHVGVCLQSKWYDLSWKAKAYYYAWVCKRGLFADCKDIGDLSELANAIRL